MAIEFVRSIVKADLITHAGVFHGDEVLATSILVLAAQGENLKILRTYNLEGAPSTAIIYDIGGGEFDHHQPGGAGNRGANNVPYASAGLVWHKFGYQACQWLMPLALKSNDKAIMRCVNAIDSTIICGVDAMDNGVELKNREGVNVYSLSDIVSGFNPEWNSGVSADECFLEAVELCTDILTRAIKRIISSILVSNRIDQAIDNAVDGKIIVLDRYMPWQGNLAKSEKGKNIVFCVFPSDRGGYNVQVVPTELRSRDARMMFPKAWWGNSTECGIDGCTFIHNSGFLAACKTKAAAIELARKAIDIHQAAGTESH